MIFVQLIQGYKVHNSLSEIIFVDVEIFHFLEPKSSY